MSDSKHRDQQWRDDQLMGLAGASFSGSIPGLRFVVPMTCRPKQTVGGIEDKRAPGIYLAGIMPSSGPALPPKHPERCLTREEALEYARGYDRLANPGPFESPHEMFARGKPEGYYPPTWEALIEAWYECLGRRLGAAISEVEDRRIQLREIRAALTGRVDTDG